MCTSGCTLHFLVLLGQEFDPTTFPRKFSEFCASFPRNISEPLKLDQKNIPAEHQFPKHSGQDLPHPSAKVWSQKLQGFENIRKLEFVHRSIPKCVVSPDVGVGFSGTSHPHLFF